MNRTRCKDLKPIRDIRNEEIYELPCSVAEFRDLTRQYAQDCKTKSGADQPIDQQCDEIFESMDWRFNYNLTLLEKQRLILDATGYRGDLEVFYGKQDK